MGDLEGKTLLVTGASRGIGLAIARRAARDGANVALLAKTQEPHPKLEGTIETAAEEDRRKIYAITDAGVGILQKEIARLHELYTNGTKHVEVLQR